jgi:hypothetical protein
LITVAMGFGILVVLFAVGDEPLLGGAGSLDVIAVASIFAVTFALAIDYQVFVLTRMREELVRTQSNDAAIEFGISKTAAVVTGAALIMIAVFSAFMLGSFVLMKMLGFALAVAVPPPGPEGEQTIPFTEDSLLLYGFSERVQILQHPLRQAQGAGKADLCKARRWEDDQ